MSWRAVEQDPEWPFEFVETDFRLNADVTALLIIDMQGTDMRMDFETEFGRKYPKIVEYWNRRIDDFVLPNIKRLLESFRSAGRRIVYTRNGPMTPHAAEETARLRSRIVQANGPSRYFGTPDHDITPTIARREGELVVDKLTSGGFNCSILDHALRNMGIHDLVITGVSTDMCVLGTARVAAELGYNTLLCEDACATYTARAQKEALLMHARVFGRVSSTQDIIAELDCQESDN